MALHIEELADIGRAGDGSTIPVAGVSVTTQTRTLSGTSAQSSAFNARTRFIRLCSDTLCYYVISGDPTATTSSIRLPADVVEYRAVSPGAAQKIAAITD